MNPAEPIDLSLGGCGGVYLLAEPGELVIEVEKRDRHTRGRRTYLRAILVGPDREVIQEKTIPHDGKPKGAGMGLPQRVRLTTRVERKGIYALNITVSEDRYGSEILWGFRTNCPRYLIETSRGHRDSRHREPIVMHMASGLGNVCFLPRDAAFTIDLSELPEDAGLPRLYDGDGKLIHEFASVKAGKTSHTVPAAERRQPVPWRLHVPARQAVVRIDGVTRWDKKDPYPDLSYWTPDAASFFSFHPFRWLLTPYSRTVYGIPGDEKRVALRVHNNSPREQVVDLALEYPAASHISARVSPERVTLPPKQSASVTVTATLPATGESRACHLRATPRSCPEVSTYSTVRFVGGTAPAGEPLEMPIVLEPYRHENEQFGYLPSYPLANQVYHDLGDVPHIPVPGGFATPRGSDWATVRLSDALSTPAGMVSTKIAFGPDNALYFPGKRDGEYVLFRSSDGGRRITAHPFPSRPERGQAFDIETFSGHNLSSGPPPVVRYTRTSKDKRLIWRSTNDLELFLPTLIGADPRIGDPILLSRLCIGLSVHSGIPSAIVSRGDRIHVAWGEATDPGEQTPGVPTYVATINRRTRTAGKPVLIGYGPPANDVHNSPSITMDSQGFLHVLIGTHGRTFKYVRSLEPDNANGGWTEPVDVGPGLSQTYVGLVCDRGDVLHLVFRLWQRDRKRFPAGHHAVLAHMRKFPGKAWEAPRTLVAAPFSEYSIFYHRLTIDRRGRLFLSYDYWSTYWFYRTDHFGKRRSLLLSPDGGETWRLARDRDLAEPIARKTGASIDRLRP